MRENKGIEKSFHRGNWNRLFDSIEDTRVLCYFICYFVTMVFPGKVLIKDYSKEGSIFFKEEYLLALFADALSCMIGFSF